MQGGGGGGWQSWCMGAVDVRLDLTVGRSVAVWMFLDYRPVVVEPVFLDHSVFHWLHSTTLAHLPRVLRNDTSRGLWVVGPVQCASVTGGCRLCSTTWKREGDYPGWGRAVDVVGAVMMTWDESSWCMYGSTVTHLLGIVCGVPPFQLAGFSELNCFRAEVIAFMPNVSRPLIYQSFHCLDGLRLGLVIAERASARVGNL